MQAAGEFAQTEEILRDVLALSGQPVKRGTMAHEHIIYMMLTEAAARARNPERLSEYIPKLEALAGRDDHRPYLAIAERAWGVYHRLQGNTAAAREHLERAVHTFRDSGAGWQLGRTYVELAELETGLGNEQSAQTHLDQAEQAFTLIRAKPDLAGLETLRQDSRNA